MSHPRFLADEDPRGNITHAVRRMEPAVEFSTIVEEGLASAADEEVLEFAWREKWLLVSHDVNTMKGLAEQRIADGRAIHGLFLVPQIRPIRPVADCLMLIWSTSEFDEWRPGSSTCHFRTATLCYHGAIDARFSQSDWVLRRTHKIRSI